MSPPLILQPFANGGDLVTVPQTDPNGFVNFLQGYTPFYEISLASGNPQAKPVERQVQNAMFNLLTANVQSWQQMDSPPWYSAMPNGYGINSVVMRQNGGGTWTPYRSLVANNVTDPLTSPTSWEYVPFGHEMLANVPMPSGGANGSSGLVITTATDFNAIGTGTFNFQTDAVTAASGHSPAVPGASAVAGMLEVMSWSNGSSTYTLQRFTDRNGNIFTRTAAGGTWGVWNLIANTAVIQAGSNNFALDTGVVNAMVCAFAPDISTRVEGMEIRVKPKFTSTANGVTINDGAGAVTIVGLGGAAVGAVGEFQANGEVTLRWNSTVAGYVLMESNGPNQVPTGSYLAGSPAIGDQTSKIATQLSAFNLKNGITTVNVAGGANVTLTPAQYGVGIILLTGALTGNIKVIVPSQSGTYVVANNTTGAFSVTLATTSAGAATALVPQTQSVVAYCDATNVILAGAAATSSFTLYTFTATAGQTVFNFPYTPGNIKVSINGSDINPTVYTATNSANLSLNTTGNTYNNGAGCFAGDDVQIIAFASFTVANAITPLGGTMTGPLMLAGGDTGVTPPLNDNSTRLQTTAGVLAQLVAIMGDGRNISCYNAASSASITFAINAIITQTAQGGIPYLQSGLNLTFNGATTGAGGMDTGALPTSGWAAIYVISGPAVATKLYGTNSTSIVAPETYGGATGLPAGYNASALVSVLPTNGSAQFIQFSQQNRNIYINRNAMINIGTASGTPTSLGVAGFIPKNAKEIWGDISGSTSGSTFNMSVGPTGAGSSASPGAIFPTYYQVGQTYFKIPIVTQQTIWYYFSQVSGTFSAQVNLAGYSI